ncbi:MULTISPECIES: CHAD domain-containing protein [unclassified Xanthobacter]|uniref:CHAD domain-containing protein n=1 Tax=unclassified Xanthobacter TaxID=2623496 RepID=UPI001EDFD983|nr:MULTISPECIES: CHAD domain-containing protein [unclassified Xanthobacter]
MMHRPDPSRADPVSAPQMSAAPPAPVSADPAARAPLAAALHRTLDKVARAAADSDPVEMVHDARKAIKEYRALLRLVDGAAARAARHAAAAVARGLAAARNRATAQEALDLLDVAGLCLACDLKEARAALASDGSEVSEAAHLRSDLERFVTETRTHLEEKLEAHADQADLAAGLAAAYGAARRTRLTSPTAMHEARKRVVTHRYQMSFIASQFGGRGAKRAGRAQRLRDVLGAYQDVETLRPMLRAASVLPPSTLDRLELSMARLQKRLKREAVRQHRALFHRAPAAFERKFSDLHPGTGRRADVADAELEPVDRDE